MLLYNAAQDKMKYATPEILNKDSLFPSNTWTHDISEVAGRRIYDFMSVLSSYRDKKTKKHTLI